jgi:hypothetical protein
MAGAADDADAPDAAEAAEAAGGVSASSAAGNHANGTTTHKPQAVAVKNPLSMSFTSPSTRHQ